MTDTETMHTPDEWQSITGVRIANPDGWRTDRQPWATPISRDEFVRRSMASTCLRHPIPLWDERDKPSEFFVERLATALKTEFGIDFGIGLNASDESWARAARGIAMKMGIGEGDESGGVYVIAMDLKASV